MASKTRLLLGAALMSCASLVIAQPASAAGTLTLTVNHPYIPVGTVGSWSLTCNSQPGSSFVEALVTYKASSPVGITGYDVTYSSGLSDPTTTHYRTNVPQHWTTDNYFDDCGGDDLNDGNWTVTAYDKSGASITRSENYYLNVVRWNNTSTGFVPAGTWAFSSGWKTSNCTCADGGTQLNNSVYGAYGSYLAKVAVAGEHRDLEMATGPARGRAGIYVDGKYRTTIDTYAPVNGNQVYVWDSGALSKGTHAIKVVNFATPGRPRIDINAMSSFN